MLLLRCVPWEIYLAILTNFFEMPLLHLRLRSTYVITTSFLHDFRCTYVTLPLIYRYVNTPHPKLYCYC